MKAGFTQHRCDPTLVLGMLEREQEADRHRVHGCRSQLTGQPFDCVRIEIREYGALARHTLSHFETALRLDQRGGPRGVEIVDFRPVLASDRE